MPKRKRKGMGRWRQGVMGFVRPALLLMLSQNEAHGYSLLDNLTEFGFNPDRVDPSMIYRTLREMEDLGLVESRLGEESLGPQRRIYRVMPEGREYLDVLVLDLRRRRDEINTLLEAYDRVQ